MQGTITDEDYLDRGQYNLLGGLSYQLGHPCYPKLFEKDLDQAVGFTNRVNTPEQICTMHSLGYRIIREKSEILRMQDDIRVVNNDNLRNILMGDAAQLAGFSRENGQETAECQQFGYCKPNRKTLLFGIWKPKNIEVPTVNAGPHCPDCLQGVRPL